MGPVATPVAASVSAPVAVETPTVEAEPIGIAAPLAVAASPAAQVYHPYASSYSYTATPIVQAAPAAVPVDITNSQYHAQDDIEQYNYGYSSPLSTKQELKTADGVTRGSYSYVDANGIVQTVNYLSDAMGFRVAATNLPVH